MLLELCNDSLHSYFKKMLTANLTGMRCFDRWALLPWATFWYVRCWAECSTKVLLYSCKIPIVFYSSGWFFIVSVLYLLNFASYYTKSFPNIITCTLITKRHLLKWAVAVHVFNKPKPAFRVCSHCYSLQPQDML